MHNKLLIGVAVIVLVAGGFFIYTNTASAPESTPSQEAGVPFGEGATTTGSTGAGGSVSPEQLASHNREDDCWVAYNGIVYDITAWLPRHPGSAKAIAPYCGTEEEFTKAFSGQHGTSKDRRLEREGVPQGTF